MIDSVLLHLNGNVHKEVRSIALMERARSYKSLGLLDKAKEHGLKVLEQARSFQLPEREVEALVFLSELERRMGRFGTALELLDEAEGRARSVSYEAGLCNILINRGNARYDQQQDSLALVDYKEAMLCAQANGLRHVEKNAVFNIASCIGLLRSDEVALAYYDSVLHVPAYAADGRFVAELQANIATLHKNEGRYGAALSALGASLRKYQELRDTLHISRCSAVLAGVHLGLGQPDSAWFYATLASTSAAASKSIEEASLASLRLFEVAQARGRSDEALVHYMRYHELHDSLSRERFGERTNILQVQYDTYKREQELARMTGAERSRRAQRNWLIVLAFLLTGLAALLFWNYRGQRRLRAQEQTLHTREVSDLLKQQEINSLESMMKGQERERERVGRDLHDRIGSMLSSVKLQFSALEGRIVKLEDTQRTQYEKVTGLLDEAVAEVRRISHDMVRGTLAEFGLLRALKDLGEALNAPGRLKVEMSAFGMDTRLPQPFEIGVYRMVQECVSNVLRHAKASELTIQVTRSGSALNVLVEDNGRGFDPVANEGGLGLRNIRERAVALGGSVNVDSVIGRGTTVSIDLPLS